MNQSPTLWGHFLRSLLSLCLLTLGVVGYVALSRARPPLKQAAPPATRRVVEVAAVVEHQGGIEFDVDGVVVPFREVALAAEVAGRVLFKADNCRVGYSVRRTDLLLRIDPRDYELEVKRLQRQLQQADGSLAELKVEAASAKIQIQLAQEEVAIQKRELARYEKIDDPGVFSKSELDAARRAELLARDALQTQIDQLNLIQARESRLISAQELVRAQLEKANLEVARTEIRSPLDGVVTSENVEDDGYLQKGAPVVVIQDAAQMEVKCSLQMNQLYWLWQSAETRDAGGDGEVAARTAFHLPETPVTVVYDLGIAKYAWDGILSRYDGAGVDQQTRMVPCRVLVPHPREVRQLPGATPSQVSWQSAAAAGPPSLMSGMFVRVRVHVPAQPGARLLRVPSAALQPGNAVWVVRDEMLSKVNARVAHSTAEEVLLYPNAGLEAGDRIVVSPLVAPSVADPVVVVEQP